MAVTPVHVTTNPWAWSELFEGKAESWALARMYGSALNAWQEKFRKTFSLLHSEKQQSTKFQNNFSNSLHVFASSFLTLPFLLETSCTNQLKPYKATTFLFTRFTTLAKTKQKKKQPRESQSAGTLFDDVVMSHSIMSDQWRAKLNFLTWFFHVLSCADPSWPSMISHDQTGYLYFMNISDVSFFD